MIISDSNNLKEYNIYLYSTDSRQHWKPSLNIFDQNKNFENILVLKLEPYNMIWYLNTLEEEKIKYFLFYGCINIKNYYFVTIINFKVNNKEYKFFDMNTFEHKNLMNLELDEDIEYFIELKKYYLFSISNSNVDYIKFIDINSFDTIKIFYLDEFESIMDVIEYEYYIKVKIIFYNIEEDFYYKLIELKTFNEINHDYLKIYKKNIIDFIEYDNRLFLKYRYVNWNKNYNYKIWDINNCKELKFENMEKLNLIYKFIIYSNLIFLRLRAFKKSCYEVPKNKFYDKNSLKEIKFKGLWNHYTENIFVYKNYYKFCSKKNIIQLFDKKSFKKLNFKNIKNDKTNIDDVNEYKYYFLLSFENRQYCKFYYKKNLKEIKIFKNYIVSIVEKKNFLFIIIKNYYNKPNIILNKLNNIYNKGFEVFDGINYDIVFYQNWKICMYNEFWMNNNQFGINNNIAFNNFNLNNNNFNNDFNNFNNIFGNNNKQNVKIFTRNLILDLNSYKIITLEKYDKNEAIDNIFISKYYIFKRIKFINNNDNYYYNKIYTKKFIDNLLLFKI